MSFCHDMSIQFYDVLWWQLIHLWRDILQPTMNAIKTSNWILFQSTFHHDMSIQFYHHVLSCNNVTASGFTIEIIDSCCWWPLQHSGFYRPQISIAVIPCVQLLPAITVNMRLVTYEVPNKHSIPCHIGLPIWNGTRVSNILCLSGSSFTDLIQRIVSKSSACVQT